MLLPVPETLESPVLTTVAAAEEEVVVATAATTPTSAKVLAVDTQGDYGLVFRSATNSFLYCVF
jgi:hypothetical protein